LCADAFRNCFRFFLSLGHTLFQGLLA
jgi:hypothetical protein